MIYKYDGSEEQCPVPLIHLRLLLKKMIVGDECIILIKDKGSVNDIPKLLNKNNVSYHKQVLDNEIIELTFKVSVVKS